MAMCYIDGLGGVKRDVYAAAQWYRKALRYHCDPEWMYLLALCLSAPPNITDISTDARNV